MPRPTPGRFRTHDRPLAWLRFIALSPRSDAPDHIRNSWHIPDPEASLAAMSCADDGYNADDSFDRHTEGYAVTRIHREPVGQWLTLPNVITAIRVLSSPALVVLGVLQQPAWLAVVAGLLVLTEWLDGFLARRLHQESALGARLDTIADAVFYSCLLIGVGCLIPDQVAAEWFWMAVAIGSYLCSWIASWIKFGRLPSYHTWMAKAAWFVVAPGILCLVLNWSPWPFRLSMLVVGLTNLEAILITIRLREARTDVPSWWHAQPGSQSGNEDRA